MLCTRCGKCVAACERRLIVRQRRGFPVMDFSRGACSFCGDCGKACTEAALSPGSGRPWDVVARVGTGCVAARGIVCRVCSEECEKGAIRFAPVAGSVAKPTVSRDDCTGCGGCIAACPTRAIDLGP